jgi:hypothetical protein
MIVSPVNATFDHGPEINIRTALNCFGQNQ